MEKGLATDSGAAASKIRTSTPAQAPSADSIVASAGLHSDADEASLATASNPVEPSEGSKASPPKTIDRPRIRYVGDYELMEEIARGGMGVVYKARQVSLSRTVAVKMILAGSFASPKEVKRFHVEAKAAANLHHPNIVGIHEVGEHEGHHYFSMDYVDGRSLADVVLQRGRLPADEAAKLVRILAEAVHYANQRGILHRDLKPQNVIIDAEGQPRITDFGLAKHVEGDSSLTAPGVMMGTPAYMPPEQARGEPGQIGTHSEVYGLGAILYFCLTGLPPFQGATPFETAKKVLHEDPRRLRSIAPTVPVDLETVCLKCLDKAPHGRYPTAAELAQDLSRFLDREPVQARPANTVRRIWNWVQRHPWHLGGISVAGLLVLVCLTYGVWQQYQKATGALAPASSDELWAQLHFLWAVALPIFVLAHYLVGKRFRLHFTDANGTPAGSRKVWWRLHLSLGAVTAVYAFKTILDTINVMVWQASDETLIVTGMTIPWLLGLLWMGVYAIWETTGAHETSLFEATVRERTNRMVQQEGRQLAFDELAIVTISAAVGLTWIASGLASFPVMAWFARYAGSGLAQLIAWIIALALSVFFLRGVARARLTIWSALGLGLCVLAGVTLTFGLAASQRAIAEHWKEFEIDEMLGTGGIIAVVFLATACLLSLPHERLLSRKQVANLILYTCSPLVLLLGFLYGAVFSLRGPFQGDFVERLLLAVVAAQCFANIIAVWRAHHRALPRCADEKESPYSVASPFLLWSSGGPGRRRMWIGAALAGLGVSGIYSLENWRGNRRWEITRQQLEAKGWSLEAKALNSHPVPDEDNFFKAPYMSEWFGDPRGRVINDRLFRFRIDTELDKVAREVTLLELEAWRPGENGLPANAIHASALTNDFLRACRELIGIPLLEDPVGDHVPRFMIHHAPNPPQRVPIVVPPDVDAKGVRFIAANSGLEIISSQNPRILRVICPQTLLAEDVLAVVKPAQVELERLIEACARPRAQLGTNPADHNRFLGVHRFRRAVECLGTRARAYLLTGKSDSAQRDAMAIRRLSEIVGLSASQYYICNGLRWHYIRLVGEGLRHRFWQNSHLPGFQQSLQQMDFLTTLAEGVAAERRLYMEYLAAPSSARATHPASSATQEWLASRPHLTRIPNPEDFMSMALHQETRPRMTTFAIAVWLTPEGWWRQDQARMAQYYQNMIEAVHSTNRQLDTAKLQTLEASHSQKWGWFSPCRWWGLIPAPSFTYRVQVEAQNQTLIHHAIIALALEQYRSTHGSYAGELEALAPHYLTRVPHDVITGQPLQYRRTPGNSYALYAVGWDGKDDGGDSKRDWVWEHDPIAPPDH